MNNSEEPSELEIIDGTDKRPVHSKVLGFAKSLGIGSAIFGVWWASCLFGVFQLLFVAAAGFMMLGLAYNFFVEGSYILAALTLFIGTPLVVGLAHYGFMLWIVVAFVSGIIFLVLKIAGTDVGFGTVMAGAWSMGWLLILLWCWFFVVKNALISIKQKRVKTEFLKSWLALLMLTLASAFTIYSWITPEEPSYSDSEVAMYELFIISQ